MTFRIFLIGLSFFSLSFNFQDQRRSTSLKTLYFGPQCEVIVARPDVVWKAWSENNLKITDVKLAIDGDLVSVQYDEPSRMIRYRPTKKLNAGQHRVEANMVVDGWAKFQKKWTFTVTKDAVESPPTPDSQSRQLIAEGNRYRNNIGLEKASIDETFCYSAALHSTYQVLNNDASHFQTVGKPGFIAETPGERMKRVGVSSGVWESLVGNVSDQSRGVRGLFDAPYHRINMMQPGSVRMGACIKNGALTMQGETSDMVQTVVSPGDGQADVDRSWSDLEEPDPLSIHPEAKRPVGYPIVLAHFDIACSKIIFISGSLKTSEGVEVACFFNTPQNDIHLKKEIFLIPQQRLLAAEKYFIQVQAKTDAGVDISRNWSFVTGS
jgi:uncharacterized protein YkwD